MPLLGSLYIGTSGLQTGQNALNTVAHNLSNIDTEGYTRQQVQQSDRAYVTISTKFHGVSNMQYGLGVSYSNVKQIRDYFLDKTYRQELGRSAFYEVSYNVMEEVEYQLGELNGEAFETDLTNLWTAVQELAKDPSNSVTQSLLVQRASEFLESSKAVYAGLSSYQDNLNAQIKQQVDKINKYGKEILELNDQIRTIESGKTEHANDLRDRRNQILDELGELCNMSYIEDMWGNVSVQIEGVDFIKGSTCYQIALDVDSSTGFYTPFWPQNAKYTITETGEKKYIIDGAEVFNLDREISSEANTDIGRLKAMVLARGDHRANYSEIEDSVLMNIQAEFDQLIHNVVTAVNEILEDAAGVVQGDLTLNDGTTLENARYITAYDRYGYMREEDGRPLLLFVKEATDEFRRVTGADGVDYFVYEEEDFGINESLYTAENIQINALLMQSPAKLSFKLEDGSVDIKTAEALKKAFEEEKYILNPKVQTMGTFVEYYSNLVAQVANSGSVYKSIYDNQEQTVEATSNARDQVLAVSSDEELSNMIRFQNAYNASSRYINVIDEMMEHLLNTLGA